MPLITNKPSKMTAKQVQEAVSTRLKSSAEYFEKMADQYAATIERQPSYKDKRKIAKIKTLAILSREISTEILT